MVVSQVSYALREDPKSIIMLQDAGRKYSRYCQITMFVRNIIRPIFFRQYLYFAPFTGANGKYRGSVTDVQMSIEDNFFEPKRDYVAMIDSEAEFMVTPSVIRQLSRDYMPVWGVKSYLDYFSEKKSGILLFLKIFKVNQELSPSYLEKGIRGSSQILKLYDERGDEISLTIDGIEPLIPENKFSYLKEEILHLLKVENALVAFYDNTEKGLNSLQERVLADNRLQGTKERWKDRHLQWLYGDLDEDDDFDMAQIDYELIYQNVLEICPGMEGIITYIRGIQPARLGEYDYYLNNIHTKSKYEIAYSRLFEMSLRAAAKAALYYYKKHGVDLEDAFQEACIGIFMAIEKHNENVAGLFPSYAAMWMRQVMNRDMSPYDYNIRIPVHFSDRIDKIIRKLSSSIYNNNYQDIELKELYELILSTNDCDEQDAWLMACVLTPAYSIEDHIINLEFEDDQNVTCGLLVEYDTYEDIYHKDLRENIELMLSSLSEREAMVIRLRNGFGDGEPMTLEEIGVRLGVTRERVRQIEAKAMEKLRGPKRKKQLYECWRNYFFIA